MQSDDIAHLALWFLNVRELALFERRVRLPQTEEAMKATSWRNAWVTCQQPEHYWLAIEDFKQQTCGFVGLEQIDYLNGDCLLPMFLSRPVRRRGLGKLAAAVVIDVAFDQLRLNRVSSAYRADNEGSCRLLAALGFKIEGRRRSSRYSEGLYLDEISCGLLRDEWRASQEDRLACNPRDISLTFGNCNMS